jgi:hypothetical protein
VHEDVPFAVVSRHEACERERERGRARENRMPSDGDAARGIARRAGVSDAAPARASIGPARSWDDREPTRRRDPRLARARADGAPRERARGKKRCVSRWKDDVSHRTPWRR